MGDNADAAADPKVLYEKGRTELQQALARKRNVDRSLAILEANLYAFEGSYLSETSNSGGNIIQGFEGYLKGSGSTRKKQELNLDNDRIFSNSSMSFGKSLELSSEDPLQSHHQQQQQPQSVYTPGITTVSLTSGPPQTDLRRDQRAGRGQRKHTEDLEPTPPPVATPTSSRPGRPPKRQRLNTDD